MTGLQSVQAMFAALSRRIMRSSMLKVLHRASTFGKAAELALMTEKIRKTWTQKECTCWQQPCQMIYSDMCPSNCAAYCALHDPKPNPTSWNPSSWPLKIATGCKNGCKCCKAIRRPHLRIDWHLALVRNFLERRWKASRRVAGAVAVHA